MRKLSQQKFISFALTLFLVLAIMPTITLAADQITIKVLAEPSLIYNRTEEFSEKLAAVSMDNKWGFVDSTGKAIIPFQYDNANSFSDGLAAVRKDGKWGYIDKTGKVVIPCDYDWAGIFSNGLAQIRKGDNWGYIDKTGKEIIPVGEYEFLSFGGESSLFKEGLMRVRKSGKYGYIDTNGHIAIPIIYSWAEPFGEGLAVVRGENHKYSFIDKTGKVVTEIDNSAGFSPEGYLVEDFLTVSYNDNNKADYDNKADSRLGFINSAGKLIVPVEYSTVENFSEGFALVAKDNKYGFVDTTGKIAVPLEYDNAYSFSDGIARVQKDGKWGAIEKTGKIAIPFLYDRIEEFNSGIASAYKDSKPCYIDTSGRQIEVPVVASDRHIDIPNEYYHLNSFSEGLAWVSGRFGYGIVQAIIPAPTATPTSSTVLINGNNTAFDAYNIDGNNYFKLRDLAMAFNNTGKNFEITWDADKNAINIISNKSYTSVGGELTVGNGKIDTISKTSSAIYLDGSKISLTAYNINGNNYFKLRDLMQALNIYVGWNDTTKTITLDTSKDYVTE